MKTVEEYKEHIKKAGRVEDGSEFHETMHWMSDRAQRITMEINNRYHTPEEMTVLLSELTDEEVDPTVHVCPPFHTDCGLNTHFGKNIYVNVGCCFQDQGGITIEDGVLIGHHTVLATINHDLRPDKRGSMTFAPIHIGKSVWIGANVTILPGVTIGDGAVVAAGAVVNKEVAPNTIVGGVPARLIKKIEVES